MVGLVADGAAEARLVASASLNASSKLWVEFDRDGTTLVCENMFKYNQARF